MITPTLINTVGAKVLWTITVENKEVPNTGVYTNLTIPPVFNITDTVLITNGTLTAGVWSIGNLAPSEVAKLILEIEYVGPTAGFDVNFDFVAQVFGLDTVSTNNTLTDTVNYKSLACGPLGGGVEDFSGCLCIDVSLNDTPCTEGTSQWVLNTADVENSITYRWDDTTGKGSFTPVDPSKPITGTYTLNCINGASTVQVSCDVPFTIYPQLESNTIFDHSLSNKKGTDLTAAEIATIKTQPEYSLLTDAQIQAYCWNTLLNGEGTLVGGWALDCNAKQDARTFFECSVEDCVDEPNPCPTCPQGSLPTDVATIVNAYADYEEEIGDTIYVKHPNAYSVYKWNGSQWVKWSCGCIFTISQDADNLLTLGTDNAPYLDPASLPAAIKVTGVDVTGTTTKTITITNSDGSTATDTFTDLDTDTTYTIDIVGNDIILTDSNGVDQIKPLPVTPNECVPINLEITEVNGTGTTAHLDIEGILPTDPEWDTWEWQVNPDWIFNADNSNWTTSQVGSLDFSLIGDDTSVRVKFTVGNCIYYSNVSGMYDHPSYDCPTIELFINPVEPSASETPVLHISGLLPANTGWDTWVWQGAPRFDINGDEVLTPIWFDAQTGGLEFNAMGDDNIVRVRLQIDNCVYYSNESGYEKPIPCGNVRLEAFNYGWGFEIFPIIKNDVPGVSTSGHPNYAPNAFVFQQLGGTAPNFTFTDVQTGEDPTSDILKYVSPTEDFYRIKYTSPSTGCIYYSNIVGVIFP